MIKKIIVLISLLFIFNCASAPQVSGTNPDPIRGCEGLTGDAVWECMEKSFDLLEAYKNASEDYELVSKKRIDPNFVWAEYNKCKINIKTKQKFDCKIIGKKEMEPAWYAGIFHNGLMVGSGFFIGFFVAVIAL